MARFVDFGDDPLDLTKFNIKERKYTNHICGPHCVQAPKKDSDFYENIHRINPYIIPYHYGFYRCGVKNLTNGEFGIVYISPCGVILNTFSKLNEYLKITEAPLDIDLFVFSKNFSLSRIKQKVYYYKEDITEGCKDVPPISCINTIENKGLSPHFSYTHSSFFHNSITDLQQEIESNVVGCSCENNCENSLECSCQRTTYEKNSQKNFGYNFKRLSHSHPGGIFECNSKCKCSSKCRNRVVSNGTRCQFQIFRIPSKGWGVRTLHFIPKGAFVSSYHGQIIPDELIEKNCLQNDYLASLDCLIDTSNDIINPNVAEKMNTDNKEDNPSSNSNNCIVKLSTIHGSRYSVDGSRFSNVGRFFNHSCNPNMFCQCVFVEHHDVRLPTFCLFAFRDILPFEELYWDYNYEINPHKPLKCTCFDYLCRLRMH